MGSGVRTDAHPVENTLGMQVFQTREDLFCERFCDFFVKLAVLQQTTPN
jgi:hypothetical protein